MSKDNPKTPARAAPGPETVNLCVRRSDMERFVALKGREMTRSRSNLTHADYFGVMCSKVEEGSR